MTLDFYKKWGENRIGMKPDHALKRVYQGNVDPTTTKGEEGATPCYLRAKPGREASP